jgi:hypothetical protein
MRGRTVDALGDSNWLVLEGYASRVESLVVATALTVAGAALVADDPERVTRRAHRAILPSP